MTTEPRLATDHVDARIVGAGLDADGNPGGAA